MTDQPAPKAPLTVWQIDAFTDRPFRGNPAAVCLLPEPRPDAWLQALAREMNLSETAFLSRHTGNGVAGDHDTGDGDTSTWDLRWFTPTTEVELCGHATLASAHFLWRQGHARQDQGVTFHTQSGPLTARRRDDGWIEMDFPALPPRKMGALPGLAAALGEKPLWVGGNGTDLLVELPSEGAVRNRTPDLAALRRLPARGIIVTARRSARGHGGGNRNGDAPPHVDYQFVSRFFAPAVGVDEDPVTGSAHCCLGPYWADKLGLETVVGYQVSDRGGLVEARPDGDRVHLAGQAVTVFRAELTDS